MISDIKKDSYTVKYDDIFIGPIELLLELIQKKKVGIYDIKLSYIIEGFAEFIKEKGVVLLDTISSFIYFSSILLEIKSRSLLPSKKKDDDTEGELDLSILKRREEEYRTYKKISNYLNNKSLEESLFFIREAPVEKGRVETPEDVDRLVAAFEKAYTTIYPVAARMPEMGYAVTAVYCEARVERIKPAVATYSMRGKNPSDNAYKGTRDVYHRKWMKFDIWEMDLLEAGNSVHGPAIVEHPMTTLVIPPENYVELDEYKFMRYKRK